MSPQELYRVEKAKAEARKAALIAGLRKAHEELVSPKRVERPRTDADRERRKLVQQEYRRRLRPIDVRV